MKTLIIYASKHGCTEKCSKLLKDKISGEVVTINIKKELVLNLTLSDNIIIGGSIYVGKIQKEVSEFCSKNLNVLKSKKVGLFICAMQEGDNAETQLNNSFPQELLSSAAAKECFGGEFIFKNMNILERFIVKKIAKINEDISNISEEKINKFAQLINNAQVK